MIVGGYYGEINLAEMAKMVRLGPGRNPDEFAGLYEKFEPSGLVDLNASLFFIPVEGGARRLDFTADRRAAPEL